MEKVGLGAGASIIGDCLIGAKTSIGSNTQVFEKNIGEKKIVIRSNSGKIIIKKSYNELAKKFFRY
jgi:serine O-acetyltransferase